MILIKSDLSVKFLLDTRPAGRGSIRLSPKYGFSSHYRVTNKLILGLARLGLDNLSKFYCSDKMVGWIMI